AILKASHGSFVVRSVATRVELGNTSPSLVHAPLPPRQTGAVIAVRMRANARVLAAIVQTPGTTMSGPVDSGSGFFRSIVPRNDKDLPGENEIRVANLLRVGFIDQRPHKRIIVDLFTRRNAPQRLSTSDHITLRLHCKTLRRPDWPTARRAHTAPPGQILSPQTVSQGIVQAIRGALSLASGQEGIGLLHSVFGTGQSALGIGQFRGIDPS